MTTRLVLRITSTVLIVSGLAVYIAAKIHFFKHYRDPDYFREHSIYWILIASIGLVLFLIERFTSEKPHK